MNIPNVPILVVEDVPNVLERFENKLRPKITQISCTERLLTTLPPEQIPAFQTRLK